MTSKPTTLIGDKAGRTGALVITGVFSFAGASATNDWWSILYRWPLWFGWVALIDFFVTYIYQQVWESRQKKLPKVTVVHFTPEESKTGILVGGYLIADGHRKEELAKMPGVARIQEIGR